MKARNWSITINNPTTEDYAEIERLKAMPWFRGWSGQLEEGAEKTPHIQAMLKTENIRFAAVKKILTRAHIEAARNVNALANYVVKDETRVASLPQVKSAGLKDLQEVMLETTLKRLQVGGLQAYYKPVLAKNGRMDWELTPLTEKKSVPEILKLNAMWLQKNAGELVDQTISEMIEAGWYGVEMYGANQMLRSGLVKYFVAINIRTNAARTSSPTQARDEDGEESTESESQLD